MSARIRIEQEAAAWVAFRDSDQADGVTEQQFDEWLNASVEHRVAYLRLHGAWMHSSRLRALRLRPAQRRRSGEFFRFLALPNSWFLWSSAGVSALFLVVVLKSWSTHYLEESRDFSTPIGAREVVALADGSKVTLNTSTRVSTVVNAHERSVWLKDGEAFFDVAHDASRPFVVFVDQRKVVVTGTKFSVRRDGDRLDVTVLEGRVQVRSADAPLTVVSRNETAIGVGTNVLVTPQTEQRSRDAVGWLEGRLFFDQMTLADAAAQFNRYNRKKVVIADADTAQIRIGGSFEAGNVDAFAHLVQTGFGLVVRETRDEIRISSEH